MYSLNGLNVSLAFHVLALMILQEQSFPPLLFRYTLVQITEKKQGQYLTLPFYSLRFQGNESGPSEFQ